MTTDLLVLMSMIQGGSIKVEICAQLGPRTPWFADTRELTLIVRSQEDLTALLYELNQCTVQQ